jgi:apolipoprotein N-acyltransferase
MADRIRAYPRMIALLTGFISATGFAPLGLWFLTLIALATTLYLVVHAETRKRAFLLGWLFGTGHFILGLNWIATAFTFQAAMPAWLGWIAVVGLSMYLAIYPALAFLAAWMIGRSAWHNGYGLPMALAFGGAWGLTEWLRSWVMTGFSWNPLSGIAIGNADNAPILANWLLPWVGTYGLSALVAGFAAALLSESKFADASTPSPRLKRRRIGLAIIIISVFVIVGITNNISAFKAANTPEIGPDIPISIVQPNVSQADKWTGDAAAANFEKLAGPTRAATKERLMQTIEQSNPRIDFPPDIDTPPVPDPAPAPRIVFWPEAAIPDYLEDGYPIGYYRLGPAAARARLGMLIGPDDRLVLGALALEFDKQGNAIGARNGVMTVDAQGRLAHQMGGSPRYDKSHLVPGGEYLPMREIFEPLGLARLAPGDLEFWPGPGPRTLSLSTPASAETDKAAGIVWPRMGVQICYEIIFSGQVADRKNRPDFIFNPSNDAWFGAFGPPQHLAQARMRAVEEGLPIIRSTPTGISAIIDAQGKVISSIGMGQAGRIDGRLPSAMPPTLFATYGNIIPVVFGMLLILFAVALARRTR